MYLTQSPEKRFITTTYLVELLLLVPHVFFVPQEINTISGCVGTHAPAAAAAGSSAVSYTHLTLPTTPYV